MIGDSKAIAGRCEYDAKKTLSAGTGNRIA